MSHQLLQELMENDLPELLNILNPVASNYFALGLQLNIQNSRICNIEHNHSTCEDRLRAVIVERLNQEEPLTLHDIVTALKTPSVNKSELARFIETQYLAAYQSPSSVTQHEKGFQSPAFQPHTALTTSTPTLSQVSPNLSQTFQSQQHLYSNHPPPHDPMQPYYTQLPSSHQQHCMYTTPPSTPFSMQVQPSKENCKENLQI